MTGTDAVMQAETSGWKQETDGWWYQTVQEDALCGLHRMKNGWYCFDENGWMIQGWKQIEDKWMFFTENGAAKTGWLKQQGQWYFFDENGKLCTGHIEVENQTYITDRFGALLHGWYREHNQWFYLDPDTGILCRNSFEMDGQMYIPDANTGRLLRTVSIDDSRLTTHNTFALTAGLANGTDSLYVPSQDTRIQYIVIHYTTGASSKNGAEKFADYFDKSRESSAAFLVNDTTILQYHDFEKGYRSWHCGDRPEKENDGGTFLDVCTNLNSIGIELCSDNAKGRRNVPANDPSWYFKEEVVENAAALVRHLLRQYPNARVIRHYDVSGKLCPGISGWNTAQGNTDEKWQAFLNRVYQ